MFDARIKEMMQGRQCMEALMYTYPVVVMFEVAVQPRFIIAPQSFKPLVSFPHTPHIPASPHLPW